MADILQTGLEWLARQNDQFRGVPVTYARGAQSAAILAVVGRTERETVDAYGAIAVIVSRDFVTGKDALAGYGEPEAGDTITEIIDGTLKTFTVAPITGKACFSYADAGRKRYRIHTKELGD